jgi:4-carboxymuconolactone decarboxylase
VSGGPRLAKLMPTELTPDQRAVYDSITGGPRAHGPQRFRLVDAGGGLEGPFNAFLLRPQVGQALQALGSAVRFETTFTDRAREIAILVVAVGCGSDFEWYAHAALGRAAGLTDTELADLGEGRFGGFVDETERTVARTVHALVERGDLDDARYAGAIDVLGEPGLFELLTLVGYYQALALQLRVFRVSPP